MMLQVQPCRKPAANFEVEMKFMNYNVEDIFGRDILQKLETVMQVCIASLPEGEAVLIMNMEKLCPPFFQQTLWNSNHRVYASKVASVLDVGGRKPIDPRDKEG